MKRFTYTVILLAACCAPVFLASCGQGEPPAAVDHRAADEATIRQLDADWAKTVAAKSVDGWVSYYADTATLLAPGAPAATGKDAIRKTVASFMAAPGFALTFAPVKVEVSKAGDLAYELGTYEMTLNDAKGKPQTQKAQYVVVWGKQADGTWKALVDAPASATP